MGHGMKKVGLLGGSFDPVHFGHLNLAFELMEKRGLDEVWFIPTQISPHKLHLLPVDLSHRLAMLHLAIEGIESFKVHDIEAKLPPPSYTIYTLQALMQQEKEYQFYLLLGEDALPGFFKWHLPQEIIKLLPLYIGSRSGVWTLDDPLLDSSIKEAIERGLTPTRLMDISSTQLRDRLAAKLPCPHLIPASALDYIHQNQLYTETNFKN
jgi:nicotinate-nucleotide adenylyltransferase